MPKISRLGGAPSTVLRPLQRGLVWGSETHGNGGGWGGGCHPPSSCCPRSSGLCRPPRSWRALASLRGSGNQLAGPTALLESITCVPGGAQVWRCGQAQRGPPRRSAASGVPSGSACWMGLAELGEQGLACSPGGSPSREQRPPRSAPASLGEAERRPPAQPRRSSSHRPRKTGGSPGPWAKVSWLLVSGTDTGLKHVPSWAPVGEAFP